MLIIAEDTIISTTRGIIREAGTLGTIRGITAAGAGDTTGLTTPIGVGAGDGVHTITAGIARTIITTIIITAVGTGAITTQTVAAAKWLRLAIRREIILPITRRAGRRAGTTRQPAESAHRRPELLPTGIRL